MSAPAWLAQMRARCAQATLGPWAGADSVEAADDWWGPVADNAPECIVLAPDGPVAATNDDRFATEQSFSDAAFIAHARTDVPALLALVEALAGALAELVAAEDQYVHEAGMVLSDPISDAVTVAREALARYAHGPGATTGGGDG